MNLMQFQYLMEIDTKTFSFFITLSNLIQFICIETLELMLHMFPLDGNER